MLRLKNFPGTNRRNSCWKFSKLYNMSTMSPRAIKKPEIKTVGIITKREAHKHSDVLGKLVKYLKRKKKKIIFDENTGPLFEQQGLSKTEVLNKSDIVIVLGGDGTILKTARRLGRKKTPVLGVNFGTLGFLTECMPPKLFEALNRVFNGQYEIDKRTLLRVTVYRKNKKLETFLALNDGVINQGAFARLISMNMEVDGRKLVNVKADGLIVSTPTGSTAHSLSAGGPIVHPKLEGLILTPICPSSLAMRSIVIPDNRQLTVTIKTERRDENAIIGLTLDGQDMMILKYGDKIKFRRSSRNFYLLRTGNRYYKTLRDKLHWGDMAL